MEAMPPQARRLYAKELAVMYREKAGRWLEDPELKKILQAKLTDSGLAYPTETFEQINESQLLRYLRDGWVIVHKLESGEVIVKR